MLFSLATTTAKTASLEKIHISTQHLLCQGRTQKERQLIEVLEKLVKMDEETMTRNEQHDKEWQSVESQREIEQREKEYTHEKK